jgi:hypothetical protein
MHIYHVGNNAGSECLEGVKIEKNPFHSSNT